MLLIAQSFEVAVCAPLCRHKVNTYRRGTAGPFRFCLVWNGTTDSLVHVLRGHRDALLAGTLVSRSIRRGLSPGSALDSALSGRLSLIVRPPHSWIHHLLIQCGLQTWYTIWGWLNPQMRNSRITEGQLYAGVECLLIGYARGKHQQSQMSLQCNLLPNYTITSCSVFLLTMDNTVRFFSFCHFSKSFCGIFLSS